VREILRSSKESVLVELSPDLDKLYFAASYSDAPRLYTAKNRYWDKGLWRNAELGDISFSSYLASRQVTHVLVPVNPDGTIVYRRKWGVRPSVKLTFPKDLFQELARVGGAFPAALLKVSPTFNENLCKECSDVGLEWNNVRAAFYSQNYVNGNKFYEDGPDLSWVYPNESPSFTLHDGFDGRASFEVQISLVAAYGANAQAQLIQVKTGDEVQLVKLFAGPAKKVTVKVASGVPVELRSFMPCTVPSILEPGNPDTRKLCFGISDVEVTELVRSSD
jgi:hypothetical protein